MAEMSYQFKKDPTPNADNLGISNKKLNKILDFNKNFTGHENPRSIRSHGNAGAYVTEMIQSAEAVKYAAKNNCTFEKAMQDVLPDHK